MKAGGGLSVSSGGESTGLIVQVSNTPPSYLLGNNGVGRGRVSIRGRHGGLPLSPPSPGPTSPGTIRFLPARNTISNIARPLTIPHRITASPQKKMMEVDEYNESIVDGKPKISKHMPLLYHWAVSRSSYGELRSVMQDHNYCAQLPPQQPHQNINQLQPVKPNGQIQVQQYNQSNGYNQQTVIQRHPYQSIHHTSHQLQQSIPIHHQHGLMNNVSNRVVSPQNYHSRPSLSSNTIQQHSVLSSSLDPELSSDDDRDRTLGGSDGEETETANEDEDNSVTRCICDFQHDDGYMICCDKCLVWQHVDCMGIERGNIPEEYRCEECQPRRVDKARAIRLQLNKRAQFKDLTPEPQPLQTLPPQPARNTVRKRTTSYSSSGKNKKEKVKGSTNRWKNDKNKTPNNNTARKQQKKQRLKTPNSRKNSVKPNSDSDRSLSSPLDNHNNNLSHSVNHNNNSTAAVAQLRQWIDSYEEAVTNHYSPELRARVSSLKLNGVNNPPAIDFSKVYIPPVAKYRISLMPSGIKIVQSTGNIPSGQVVVEVRGKFMLAKGKSGPSPGPPPGPYVFYHKVSPEYNTEICVDARTYGNDSRFIRRSCQPNCELRHCIEKGAVHLYIVSTKVIENKTEMTLPLSIGHYCVCNGLMCQHDPHANPNSQVNYSMDKRRRGRRRTLSESSSNNPTTSSTSPKQQPTTTTQSTTPTTPTQSTSDALPPVVKQETVDTIVKEEKVEVKEPILAAPVVTPTLPPPPPPPPPPVTPTSKEKQPSSSSSGGESPPQKKKIMSPPREKEVKIKEEIKEEEPTTPNSREEKKKHVKRSMSVVQGKTAGSLLARAVTTRRATTPSARTEEKRLRAHNGEPTPKDNSKMTREERKMEAIMKAFERLEKNEQRKQQQHTPSTPTEKRPREPSQRKISETSPKSPRKQSLNRRESRMSKVSLRSRGRSNLNQQRNRSKIKSKAKTRRSRSPRFTASTGEESSDDEVMSPRKPPVQRRRRIQQNKKRPPTPPSPDKDDEEDEEEIEEEEESNSPLRNVKMGETPPLSNTCLLVAAAVGPLAPGFKFPKTKKNMLNSWLVGEGGSTPPLQEETPDQSTETNDQPEQNSDSQDNVQTSSADHCTAKKRWLRQAISEDSDSPRLDGGSGSPVEMAAPLKKRRVARESVSSDTAFTPPTTPSTEQLTQIYEDDENSAGLSPARESEANQVNTASDQQQIPSDTQLQPENCGSSTPKLFESPRSDDSKPLSPETAVVPKSVEVSSKDESSELPPMQVAEDPESQLAAMEEEISSPVKSEPSVKPVSDMSKEHADAVELLKELTTDEPQRDTVNEAVNETEHGDEQVDSPVKHSAEEKMEEKESAKIKRKLSISEYRERVKSNPPKQKKWSDDESAIDKKLNNSNDSDSDESSSEINSLLAKIDAANIDFGVTSFKKGTGSFSAEPTLVEKQREALTDRLKREFGLFLSDDEEKTIANAANQIQNNADGKAGDAGNASISPNSSRLVRDRRTRRPPPPPPSGPPPPPVLGPPPPPTTLPQVLPTSQRLPAVIPTMPPVLTPQPPPGLVGQTGGPAWGFYPPNGSGLPPPPPLPPQHRYHMRH